MPSEFNHIDDFFRRKEDEAGADNSMQDTHWQQMKGLLVNPAPPSVAKIRTLNPKLLWQLIVAVSFVAVVSLLVWKNFVRSNAPVQADHASKQIITTDKDNQVKITNQQSITATNPNSQDIDTPFVWNGDLKINLPIADRYSYLNQPSNEIRAENKLLDIIQPDSNIVSPDAQLASFFDQLKKPGQEFIINSNRDTTIICNEGTRIFIPAGSFRDDNGDVSGEITFKTQEFYEMADIIGHKLTTSSNGQMLGTGGMLRIEAEKGNNKLALKSQSSLKVEMPTKRFDPQMQLFYGNQGNPGAHSDQHDNSIQQAGLNWNPAGQQQFNFDFDKWTITVTDFANDPRQVVIRRGKKIAKFIVSDAYAPRDMEQFKAELKIRIGMQYDEIKVRTGWNRKRYSENQSLPATMTTIDGMVGEQVRVTLKDARLLGLISARDSAWHVKLWKQQVEKSDSLQRQYLQLREQYTFNITSMGWINCDKFLARMGQRTRFVASTGDQFENTYFQSFLIFKDMNSVLGGTWADGKLIFDGVPVGKRVTLVCVGVKNGKAYTSFKETNISPDMVTGLEFQETTPENFREKMKMFGNVQKG